MFRATPGYMALQRYESKKTRKMNVNFPFSPVIRYFQGGGVKIETYGCQRWTELSKIGLKFLTKFIDDPSALFNIFQIDRKSNN